MWCSFIPDNVARANLKFFNLSRQPANNNAVSINPGESDRTKEAVYTLKYRKINEIIMSLLMILWGTIAYADDTAPQPTRSVTLAQILKRKGCSPAQNVPAALVEHLPEANVSVLRTS